jgi:hypothetical protein
MPEQLGKAIGLLVLVLSGCSEVASSEGHATSPSGPSLAAIAIQPHQVSLLPGATQAFTVTATWSDATSGAVNVAFQASGGTATASGVYTAGASSGIYRVIAKVTGSNLADTATVTIIAPPPPPPSGPYQTIGSKNWAGYADKSSLVGLFGVEGGLHNRAPALPVTDFYDLVSDPLFGKVVRYNGGPHLNIAAAGMPGRTATHQFGLNKKSQPNATWWTPPSGGAHNVDWFPTHVWVRQFIRFSPNWTPMSSLSGEGGPSYKTMFLRYWGSAARHEWTIDGPRGVFHSGGNPGLTKVANGQLPWHNTVTMNVQCKTDGWSFPDFWPAIKTTGPYPSSPGNCAYGPGNGEWVEVIFHHNTQGARGEFSMYWRQYTVGGAVAPSPWKINAWYLDVQPGQSFIGIANYQMGVNRNRWYDEPMFIYWGPYEVVDGSAYPDPWGVPGGS